MGFGCLTVESSFGDDWCVCDIYGSDFNAFAFLSNIPNRTFVLISETIFRILFFFFFLAFFVSIFIFSFPAVPEIVCVCVVRNLKARYSNSPIRPFGWQLRFLINISERSGA